MKKYFLFCLSLVMLTCVHQLSLAEVISVDPIETGMLYSSGPTQTFLWKAPHPKALLIFIPGGEGKLGLTADKKNLGGFYGNTLRPLSDPNLTSGLFDVVVFDSPNILAVGSNYPTSRSTADHLMRIESVVKFYKEKFGLSIWLMGHSNGAVSVTEFYKYLQKNNTEAMIAGIIYSSARNGATFNVDTQLPVLFLAHEQDRCSKSTPSNSQSVYRTLKETDKLKTEYVLITSGESQSDDPCRSGFHMFFGAGEQAYKAIDGFVSAVYK